MQNAKGGVNDNLLGILVMEELNQTSTKSATVTTETFKPKVYGKKGRRIRAAERLSKQLAALNSINEYKAKVIKSLKAKQKLTSDERDTLSQFEWELSQYGNTTRIEQELATLKNRI